MLACNLVRVFVRTLLMDDIHLSRQILRAVEQGKLPRSFLEEIATEHLLTRCPHCRVEFDAFEAERRAGTSVLHRLFLLFSALLERFAFSTPHKLRQSEQDIQEILRLSPTDRIKRIDRARNRFRGLALIKLLLDESRRCVPGRAAEAFQLADLARRIILRSPRMPGHFDWYTMATAFMGNARRAAGDLQQAGQLFLLARQVIAEHGVTDPEVVARVDDLLGSLRKDQRRFAEAEKILKRAAAQFGLIDAADDVARCFIKLGDTYQASGVLDRAIEATRSALALLGPASDLRLQLCARHNLTLQLVKAERYEEALAQLTLDEELYRRFPEPWVELRVAWLRGDIAAGTGDVLAAERAYRETRDGFVTQGIGYDAAMVSLDLAVLFLRQGRTDEVRRLAEEMLPIFQAQDIHREAFAALALFQEAARHDQMTPDRALEILTYLREARTDPERRFGWKKRKTGPEAPRWATPR
jgi:tetratricopeptide (TPR) repeat protein